MDSFQNTAEFLLGFAVLVVWYLRNRASRCADLEQLADRLHGSFDYGRSRASGTYLGVPIVHQLSWESGYTAIACPLPRVPAALHIVPQHPEDAEQVARGEMVDLEIGDAAFDARYRVEGAPAEVVRRALDPELRAYLCAHHPVELRTAPDALWLAQRGVLATPEAAEAAWDVLLAIRRAIEQADSSIDEDQLAVTGAPFRPELDDSAVPAGQVARSVEVDALERRIAKRTGRGKLVRTLAVATLFVATAAAGALAIWHIAH